MKINPIRFHIFTLGCKINQYESQALRESWLKLGYAEAEAPEEAGLILINTCAVTARAVADARQSVRRLAGLAKGADIVVSGCAARLDRASFEAVAGVSRVVPQTEKAVLCQGPFATGHSGNGYSPLEISDYPRARPVLKVQDGCSRICTYCIVPYSRGPSRSRPAQSVLAEAERLAEAGFEELVISGVNLSQWGRDFNQGEDFWDLLLWLERRLAPKFAGKLRLRLSSLDPWMLGRKAIEVINQLDMLCPHLHVSLQSADPKVLRDMGRDPETPETLPRFLDELSQVWSLYGLGADLLTGFPSESPQAFERTLKFVGDLPLSYAHVFPYSRRPGTKAHDLKSLATSAEKRERAAKLRALTAAKKTAFLNELLKLKELSVIIEETAPAKGVSEHFVSCRIKCPEPGLLHKRRAVFVRPLEVTQDELVCEALPPKEGK